MKPWYRVTGTIEPWGLPGEALALRLEIEGHGEARRSVENVVALDQLTNAPFALESAVLEQMRLQLAEYKIREAAKREVKV